MFPGHFCQKRIKIKRQLIDAVKGFWWVPVLPEILVLRTDWKNCGSQGTDVVDSGVFDHVVKVLARPSPVGPTGFNLQEFSID